MSWQAILNLPIALAFVSISLGIADEVRDRLWSAVRSSDKEKIIQALNAGAELNSANEYGVTALWIAAGKDKPEIVQLLIDHGANVNSRDGIWYQTPLSLAIRTGAIESVRSLLAAGATDVDEAIRAAAAMRRLEVLDLLLDSKLASQDALDAALFMVKAEQNEVAELLAANGAKKIPAARETDRARWSRLAGTYENDNTGTLVIASEDVGLVIKSLQGDQVLRETGPGEFAPVGIPNQLLRFELNEAKVSRIRWQRYTAETYYFPTLTLAAASPESALELEPGLPGKIVASNWPQFRGPDACGFADGQDLPVTWDLASGSNVSWRRPVGGLGHSCPVIWGNHVFLTTAISGQTDSKLRVGNYGDVDSVDDKSKHSWRVVCFDLETGLEVWNREVYTGIPKIKRHVKGSQANCTIATDGENVVACFGAEGLFCLDYEGQLRWSRDLSSIDASFALDQEFEWGFASSPILFQGLVFVQFDLSHDSMMAAFRLSDGDKVWETARDEIPSWSSPVIWRNSQRTELVTNASQFARSYDPLTGRELWRLAKKSEATIPAPVPIQDRLILCSGNRPIQPIFAVMPGGEGDISLTEGESANRSIAWSTLRGGPYMSTPIAYRELLYVCSNAGVLTAYELATGKIVYRQRIGGLSYTASAVAADGRLYFVSEQGEVRVVQAGPEFKLLSVNDLEDYCLASPAIASGRLLIRTQHELICLRQGAHFHPTDK